MKFAVLFIMTTLNTLHIALIFNSHNNSLVWIAYPLMSILLFVMGKEVKIRTGFYLKTPLISYRSELLWLIPAKLSSVLTVTRPDWLLASNTDVSRSNHQELRPGAESAEREDKQAGGGEGGSSQPEPGCQWAAQAASAQTGTGAANS